MRQIFRPEPKYRKVGAFRYRRFLIKRDARRRDVVFAPTVVSKNVILNISEYRKSKGVKSTVSFQNKFYQVDINLDKVFSLFLTRCFYFAKFWIKIEAAMSSAMYESLGAKVAMFNQYASKHKDKQSKNPFTSGINIEKPKFSKDEYGRPEAGSLSDLRGRKANAHILKEILELCEIISHEGTPCRDQPDVIAITFGDIFNIYTNISSKCVGLLLRARKQKYLEFEGECLFQRRDDDVPIFLVKPIEEIRKEYNQRLEEVRKDLLLHS